MHTSAGQDSSVTQDVEVNIGSLESSVRMVDDATFLSPQIRRQILQIVLQAMQERDTHQMRVRAEQRIGGGVRADYEEAS